MYLVDMWGVEARPSLFFFFPRSGPVPSVSLGSRTSSNKFPLLSCENRQPLSQRSRGSSGDQRQSSTCLSSGKPDDPLQSDNVNSSLATGGTVGVWSKTGRILLQDKCKDDQHCKLCSFYLFIHWRTPFFSLFLFFLPELRDQSR